jgi:hypothetical protein
MQSNIVLNKVNLRNFGADAAVVIIDSTDERRTNDFVDAWSSFDGLDYHFSQAIFPSDFDINELIKDGTIAGEWHDKDSWFCLSDTLLAISLAHQRAWQYALENLEGDKFLFLEDDARPSPKLCEDIYDGTYKQFIDDSKIIDYDIMWLGKAQEEIKGDNYTYSIQRPDTTVDTCGQGYILSRKVLEDIAYSFKHHMSADLFIDTLSPSMSNTYSQAFSPYYSYIAQQGQLLKDGFLQKDKTHPDFIYSSRSQVNIHTDELLPLPFTGISKAMFKYCEPRFEEYTKYGLEWRCIKFKKPGLI